VEFLIILKIIFLFLGVWMTIVNTGRLFQKDSVPAVSLFIQAVGIVGFIVIQTEIWK